MFCTSGSLKLKDLYFKVYKQEISGFHLLETSHVHEHDWFHVQLMFYKHNNSWEKLEKYLLKASNRADFC